MDLAIRHLPERHRFEARPDGDGAPAAHLDYRQDGGRLTLVHTEVPAALSGRGVGGALVQAALDHARANRLEVDPQCSYARHYLETHPQPKAGGA